MKSQPITFRMLIIISSSILVFGLSSCKKSEKLMDEGTTETMAVADLEDDNAQTIADQAYETGSVNLRQSSNAQEGSLISTCATVTRDTTSSPRTITIDFGTGCTGNNNVTRSGKIIATYTGAYRATGTVIHITTDNYYVNGNKVDIDRTVTNNGINANGFMSFNIQSTRTVTFADGTTINGTSTRIREWIAGEPTRGNYDDDVYRVTGSGTFTNRRGLSGTFSTQTPLIRKVACHQFVSGIVKAVRDDDNTKWATVDFGNDTCDDLATITLSNGRTFTKTLRR